MVRFVSVMTDGHFCMFSLLWFSPQIQLPREVCWYSQCSSIFCPQFHTLPIQADVTSLLSTNWPKNAYTNTLSHGPKDGQCFGQGLWTKHCLTVHTSSHQAIHTMCMSLTDGLLRIATRLRESYDPRFDFSTYQPFYPPPRFWGASLTTHNGNVQLTGRSFTPIGVSTHTDNPYHLGYGLSTTDASSSFEPGDNVRILGFHSPIHSDHSILDNNPVFMPCEFNEFVGPVNPFSSSPLFRIHQVSHDQTRGTRIGEASHPGPPPGSTPCRSLSVSLLNPTTMYQKEDELLALNSDVLCLAETAATCTVQRAFNQAIRTTVFRTFWSAPVPDKITKEDPYLGQTLRGDNLGTAIITRLPAWATRHGFPPAVWDTCRLNSVIVSTGCIDVSIVSAYFQTGKSAEARVVNNQLLRDVLLHVIQTDMPFIIAGDFNMDVRKLDAFSTFLHMGCQEMFEFHRAAFGFELPPTCKGATRFDSMIFHPFLLKYIRCVDIGPEHQFADHRVVHTTFNIPTRHVQSFNWFVPKSWTLFPVDAKLFAATYRHVRTQYHWEASTDAAVSLYKWSSHVETAVDRALRRQQVLDPWAHTQKFLPKTYRGRCATPKLVRTPCPMAPKKDAAGLYEPPVEVTCLKSKQKVRQVRRLRCLEQMYRKYQLSQVSQDQWATAPAYNALCLVWQAICKANGYGRSWIHWLLQFEAIPAVSVDLPTFDQLYSVRQITQYDADLYCQQEAKFRRLSHKHGIDLDIKHKSGSHFYKRLKDHETKILPGFPVAIQAQATLLRNTKGPVRLVIHQPVTFRLFAAVKFGTATLRILAQQDNYLTCQLLDGILPAHDTAVQNVYAFDISEMTTPFADYWAQFWNRDPPEDETSDDSWTDILQSLRTRIPPQAPLPVVWNDSQLLTQTIHKLKPFKAAGIDGWRAEELQTLPQCAIEDLSHIFAQVWPSGLSTHQMIARVILLAKRTPATSISDGRPITILGYISRLTSKIIADQLLSHWSLTWPSAISGGLPFRGVQDITFMQQFQIESAKTRTLPWRGFTLDLIKAFNLLPRRVLYHLLIHHGAPPASVKFWFLNLSKLTRRLQVRQAIGPAITMTTGVPEGDSLSVCAMLVTSSAFYWTLSTPTVFPYAYADNWSYLTTNQRDNIRAFRKIQDLVHAFRMQIDYAKSWAWGATAEARKDWQEFLRQEFPHDNQVHILNSTKDLGCMTHYTRHITLGHLKTKIQNAVQRCKRIRWFQTDLLQKARFIQTAVWPHAFFWSRNPNSG